MNPVERIIHADLFSLIDRLASFVPPGGLSRVAATSPTLRPRLDEAETRLADVQACLLADYGRWRRALEDVENLWALASWRDGERIDLSAAAQEAVEQASALAA